MSMDYNDFSPVRVAVVGGGAAGMMAAVAAANMGADVTLFERNDRLGKKLRITGKGRCNVTNDCDRDTFLSNVPTNPRFLYSALAAFTTADTKAFFEDLVGRSRPSEAIASSPNRIRPLISSTP